MKLNLSSKKLEKRLKICIFPNGLDHGFVKKLRLSPTFVLMQNGSIKIVLVKFQKEWKSV